MDCVVLVYFGGAQRNGRDERYDEVESAGRGASVLTGVLEVRCKWLNFASDRRRRVIFCFVVEWLFSSRVSSGITPKHY